MAPHPSSALAAPDTGPTGRVDVPDDDRAAEEQATWEGLDGPTVTTSAVGTPQDEDDEHAEPDDGTTDTDEADPAPEPDDEADDDAHTESVPATGPEDDEADDHADPVGASTVPVAPVEPPEGGDPAEADTTTFPAAGRRRRFRVLPRSRWLRRSLAALAAVVLVLAAVATPSLVHALTRRGSDTVPARLAEWGRDHGLGPLVTWAEARQYDLDQPATGGTPAGGIPHATGAVVDHPGGSPAPPPLPAPAGLAPLPGEGQWQTVVATPHGDAVRLTTVRPDAAHTSFLVGVLWLNPTLVRGVLHPGTEDPGGDFPVPPSVDSTEQRTVVSAFSAGFRLQGDSHGGWYLDGKEARPLVPGAASLVIHRDGNADVGAWGSEVRMTPDVVAVRQNLVPLVDHGVVNPTCATGGTAEWGSTVGQAAYINRSAFGVTATGAEIYVGGPALSVCTLGEILRSAGAVRGMELDINPAWVSGAYFHPTGQPRPDAFQLFPDEQVGAQHYLQTSSRDFVSFDLRSLADATGAGTVAPSSQHHGTRHGGSNPSGDKHHP
ncbi:hypothetical protein [Actinomycetospora sp. TBRC 11914]|uniref:hypothetical protein n=1 Tax=Actinomycetospora sp. TBRC 11914 TaxID=2729387 RepID=UPI00145D3057|nr:hypothetical protein [Actinomycetospora sp. TBRC 11914]NMO89153.1 hypothetical protein [Actinomycetospora sp. TBRC 11914]